MINNPMAKILVSDFDGVICNGIREYFHSSKLTYQQIWSDINADDLDALQPQFNILRPVVETGWEMPMLLKALITGETTENILLHWSEIRDNLVKSLQRIKVEQIPKVLDQVRNSQIDNYLDQWLDLHDFYQGVIPLLKKLIKHQVKMYIITTKGENFARTLLEKQDIFLPKDAIFGKECKRPKYESLRLIIDREQVAPESVYFIEDRLEALELVAQQPDLQKVNLWLADWGYNTEATRLKAQKNPRYSLFSLAQFTSNDVF